MRRSSLECLRNYAPLLLMISLTVYCTCFYFDLSEYGVTRNLNVNELVEATNRSVIDHLHLKYFRALMGGDSLFHCICLVTVGTFLRSIFIHVMKYIEDSMDSTRNPSTGYHGSIMVLCTLDAIFAISYFDMAMGYSGIVFSSFGRLQHIARWNAYITLAPLMIAILLCVHTDGLNENTSIKSDISTFNNSYTLFANKKSRNTFVYMFTTSLLAFVGTILAAQSTYVRSKELCILLGCTSFFLMATLVALVYSNSASMFTREETIKEDAERTSPVNVPNTLTETVLKNHNNFTKKQKRENHEDTDSGHSTSKTTLQPSSSSGQLSSNSSQSSHSSISSTSCLINRDITHLNLNESNLSSINSQTVTAKKGSRTWKSTRQTPTSKKSYYLASLYMVVVFSLFCVHVMANMEWVNIQTEAFLFMFVDILAMAVMSNLLLKGGMITMTNLQYIELIKGSKKVVQDRTNQFLKFISHEMATPLSSLAMFIEYITEMNISNSKDEKEKIDTEVMQLAQESMDDLSEVLKELSHFCRMDGEITSLEDEDMVMHYNNPSSTVLDDTRTRWIKKIEMLTSSLKQVSTNNESTEKAPVTTMPGHSTFNATTNESSNHPLFAHKHVVNEERSIFDLKKTIRLILMEKSKSDKTTIESSKDGNTVLAKQMTCQVVDLKGVSKSVTLVNETSLSTSLSTKTSANKRTALPGRVVANQGVIREVLSLLLSEALSVCKAGCKAIFSAEMTADMLSGSTAASSYSDTTSVASSPRGGTHTYPATPMDAGSTSPRTFSSSRRDICFSSPKDTSTSTNSIKMDSGTKSNGSKGTSPAMGRNAPAWDPEIDNFRFVRFRLSFPSEKPLSQQEIDHIFDPWKNLIPGGSMKNSSVVRGMILSFALMRRLLKQSQCNAHLNIECDDDGNTEYILEIEIGCLSDKDLKAYLESIATSKTSSSSSSSSSSLSSSPSNKTRSSANKKNSPTSKDNSRPSFSFRGLNDIAEEAVGGLDSEITTPAANLDVESGSRSGIDIENVTEGYESNLFYCDLEPATSSVTGDKQNNILVEEGRSKSGSIGRSRSWSSFLYGFNSQPSSTSLDRDFGINYQQIGGDGGSSLSLLKESYFGSIDSINTDITPSSRSAASTPTKSKQYADLVENSNLTGNRRCLVVEDEDANRHLCAKLTTAFGYDTMQASDGIECLQMVLGQANVSKVDLLRAQRSQNSTLGTLMHSKNMPSISMKSINDMMRMSSSDAKNSTSSGDDETKESKSERKEEVFDLVVIDNWMPNLSGMESVRRLRSANYNGTIIGLTAQTDESVLEAFKNAGCDKVFAKPLKVDEFQQYLRSKQLEMDTNNANTPNHEFKGSM